MKLTLIPIPAIIIGSLAMYLNDVSIKIWSQNILGLVIGLLLCYLISRTPKIIGNAFTIPGDLFYNRFDFYIIR